MRPKNNTLTPQELEIMKLVWQRGAATVRDVYEVLLERRKIAYTTVMTMMKILETKAYLKKRRQDRAFIYRPAHPKNQVIGGMIREFIDRVFNGSAAPLLAVSLLLPLLQPWHHPQAAPAIAISADFAGLPLSSASTPAATHWHLPNLQTFAPVLGIVILVGIALRLAILALGLLKLRRLR